MASGGQPAPGGQDGKTAKGGKKEDKTNETFWNEEADRDADFVVRHYTCKTPAAVDKDKTRCDVAFAGEERNGKKTLYLFTASTDSNQAFVAGCLNVPNVFAMRRTFAQKDFMNIGNTFEDAQENNYLIPLKQKAKNATISIKTEQILNSFAKRSDKDRFIYLWNLDPSLPWSQNVISDLNSRGDYEIPTHFYGVWCMIRAALNVVRTLPTSFPDSADEKGELPVTSNDFFLAVYAFKGWRSLRTKHWDPKGWGLTNATHSKSKKPTNARNAPAYKIFIHKPDLDPEADEGAPFLAEHEEKEKGAKTKGKEPLARIYTREEERLQFDVRKAVGPLEHMDEARKRQNDALMKDVQKILAAEEGEDNLRSAFAKRLAATNLPRLPEELHKEVFADLSYRFVSTGKTLAWLKDVSLPIPWPEKSASQTLVEHLAGQEATKDVAAKAGDAILAAIQADQVASSADGDKTVDIASVVASLRGVSMELLPYVEAAAALFPNGEGETLYDRFAKDREAGQRLLYKHQVQAVFAILDKLLNSPLKGVILADGCGLGKSIIILAAFLATATEYNKRNPDGPFYPILLVFPSSICEVWLLEFTRFFADNLSCVVYHGSGDILNASDELGCRLITSAALLRGFYLPGGIFDRSNPKTSFKIVFTSYSTYARRTLINRKLAEKLKTQALEDVNKGVVDDVPDWNIASDAAEFVWKYRALQHLYPPEWKPKRRARMTKQQREDSGFVVSDDADPYASTDDEEDDFAEEDEFVQPFSGFWATQALDEGHAVKNRESMSNAAVRLNNPLLGSVIVSATILSNSISDAVAILELLWPAGLQAPLSLLGTHDDMSEYILKEFYENNAIEGHFKVCPDVFVFFIKKGIMDLKCASRILPIIFRAAVIHRETGDMVQVGDEAKTVEIIGKDIPSRIINSLYIRPDFMDSRAIFSNFIDNAPYLTSGKKRKKKGRTAHRLSTTHDAGTMNWRARNEMVKATFLPQGEQLSLLLNSVHMAKIASKENEKEKDTEGGDSGKGDQLAAVVSLTNLNDHGAAMFVLGTLQDHRLTPGGIAEIPRRLMEYMTGVCPKLLAVVSILNYHIITRSEKVIITTMIPRNEWITEIFLHVSGIPFLAINSTMDMTERAKIFRRFNDPSDKQAMVLLANSRLIGQGHNLHGACSTLIILEVQPNLSDSSQTVGRVTRTGQTLNQTIYIVIMEHSFEEKAYARNIRKYLPIAIGMRGSDKSGMEQLQTKARLKLGYMDSEDLGEEADAEVMKEATKMMTCIEFGLREDSLTDTALGLGDIGIDWNGQQLTKEQRKFNLSSLAILKKKHYQQPFIWELDPESRLKLCKSLRSRNRRRKAGNQVDLSFLDQYDNGGSFSGLGKQRSAPEDDGKMDMDGNPDGQNESEKETEEEGTEEEEEEEDDDESDEEEDEDDLLRKHIENFMENGA